jgi:hypothetical protein
LRVNGRRVSTVDLLGDGLTVFAGGQGGRSAAAAVAVSQRAQLGAPLAVHTINDETAAALGVAADGALLLRPDGRELARLGAGTVVTDRGG